MKKLIPFLLGAWCITAACSKKDKDVAPEEQPKQAVISRIVYDPVDTTDFTYHADGTLKQFRQYGVLSPFYPDSTQAVFTNGLLTAFKIWVMPGEPPRPDRSFQYNTAQQLTRVNYHVMISESEMAITDYDSLVYEQGRLSAMHVVNGSLRTQVYRFTWEKDNISTVKYYDVMGGDEQLQSVTSYVYTDKPSLQLGLPKYLLFLHNSSRNFADLSANAPQRSQIILQPNGDVQEDRAYAYTLNEEGQIEKIAETVKYIGRPEKVETVIINYHAKQ